MVDIENLSLSPFSFFRMRVSHYTLLWKSEALRFLPAVEEDFLGALPHVGLLLVAI
jgi:hypothetical protein